MQRTTKRNPPSPQGHADMGAASAKVPHEADRQHVTSSPMPPAARKPPLPSGTEPLAPGTPDEPKAGPEPVRMPLADEPDEVDDEAEEDEQEEDEDQPKAIAGLDASTAVISPFGGSQYGTPGIHIDSVTDPSSPKTTYRHHHG